MKEVKNITVLGAGAMGAQIGALMAEAGYNVKIRDIEDKSSPMIAMTIRSSMSVNPFLFIRVV